MPDGLWTHPTLPPEPWTPRDPSRIDEFSIHHSVSVNKEWTTEEERNHILNIYDQHKAPGRFEALWSAPGIGYNWLAFPSGRIYYVGSIDTQRAAVRNQNHHIVACCLVGNFTDELPTGTQIDAVRSFRLENWSHLVRRPHRYYNIPGSIYNTACPGNTFEQWIEQT